MKASRLICLVLAIMLLVVGCGKKEPATPEALCEAAEAGDIKRLRSLLSRGVDVNSRVEGARTPLQQAAGGGHKDIVELLIAEGAEIDAVDLSGVNALLRALWRGNEHAAELLLTRGASADLPAEPNEPSEHSELLLAYHPLHHAAMGGYERVAELLIAGGADVNVRSIWDDNETALHMAISHGKSDMARLLIANGADISALSDGMHSGTPLHHAVLFGSKKHMAELLISKSAEVNARNRQGRTPLIDAILRDRPDMFELLLASGADVNASGDDAMVFDYAVKNGYTDVAKEMISKGIDVNATDFDGATALHRAARWGSNGVVELLISNHANVNATSSDGKTPLHAALRQNHRGIVELLVAGGANLDATGRAKRTILHEAACYRHKTVAELALANGADVNARDADGMTPLHYAVREKNMDMARLLIANGADVHARTSFTLASPYASGGGEDKARATSVEGAAVGAADSQGGITPMYYALIRADKEAMEMLTAKGAKIDVNFKYRDGWTLLHDVAWLGQANSTRLLLDLGADVNAKTQKGRTPMDVALDMGSRQVVDILNAAGGKFGIRKNAGRGWIK